MFATGHYVTAARRANARLDFYSHLTMYVLVNLMLAGLNLIVTPTIVWFVFPLAGWGVGLVIHGLMVFVTGEPRLRKRSGTGGFPRPHGS